MGSISRAKVEAQLEKVLASPDFRAGKRSTQFLRWVAEEALNGRSATIKQTTIATEALGYGAGFDPQTNPIVRIHARQVRRALEHYYFTEGSGDPVRIDIPKGGYVPVFQENGTTGAPASPETRSPSPARSLREVTDQSIAVFMFEHQDQREESVVCAKGLTGEIITSLTRFEGLKVVGPLLQASDGMVDYPEIYHGYGARFVLHGGLRCQGSKMRITTGLTDASTAGKAWGRTFQFDLEETPLFDLEDEVCGRVTGAIADSLGIIFQRTSTESYPEHLKVSDVAMAVMHYNHSWATHAPKDFGRAISSLKDALEKHPDNALLLALLANLYYGDVLHDLNLAPESASKMDEVASMAVSLDPDLQIAQYNLVPFHAFHGRVAQCTEQARKVVGMNPYHARILAGCAIHTTTAGAYELGLELIARAKQLNPHYPGFYHFVDYLVHFAQERYEEAWEEALNIHVEGLLWHPIFRASVLGMLGRAEEAKPYLDDLLRMKPEFPKRPGEYLRRLFVLHRHVETILDGLRRAGLETESGA